MLTEDCRRSPKCINSILESELKYSTYKFISEILGNMKNFLPDILDNAQRDIQRKLDEEYKKQFENIFRVPLVSEIYYLLNQPIIFYTH